MKITTEHSASSYGIPVIIDDEDDVMDYAPGVKALREKLNLTTQQLAEACGCSRRTVEGWEQGRVPEAAALNVMSALLKSSATRRTRMDNTTNEQPGVCGLCRGSGIVQRHPFILRCGCGAAADDLEGAPEERGTRSLERLVRSHEFEPSLNEAIDRRLAEEWVGRLRVIDGRAREGAAFCWENATSVEGINMGDKFWAIHCDIIAMLAPNE